MKLPSKTENVCSHTWVWHNLSNEAYHIGVLCTYMWTKRFFLLPIAVARRFFVCSAIKKLRILISKAFSYISHLNRISSFLCSQILHIHIEFLKKAKLRDDDWGSQWWSICFYVFCWCFNSHSYRNAGRNYFSHTFPSNA